MTQALLLAPYRHVIQKLFNCEHHQDADIHFAFVNGMWWQWCNQLFVVKLILVYRCQLDEPAGNLDIPPHGITGQLPLIDMADTSGTHWFINSIQDGNFFW